MTIYTGNAAVIFTLLLFIFPPLICFYYNPDEMISIEHLMIYYTFGGFLCVLLMYTKTLIKMTVASLAVVYALTFSVLVAVMLFIYFILLSYMFELTDSLMV